MKFAVLIVTLFSMLACSMVQKTNSRTSLSTAADEFLWLEEVEGTQALSWVKKQNQISTTTLKNDPRYTSNEAAIAKILGNKDRIPMPEMQGNMIYNHWTDDQNPRGLWRRCPLDEYQKASPQWELVLNIDELGKTENESWVFKGANPLPPSYKKALVFLSRGGKDAVEVREFDLEKKAFVSNGFFLPESKTDVTWVDENTLLVATDFGPGSMSKSGYARILKKWTRGTPLTAATLVYEATPEDMAVGAATYFRPEGTHTFVYRNINFYEYENYYLSPQGGITLLPLPKKSYISSIFHDKIYFSLKEDWTVEGQTYTSGSLVALKFSELLLTKKLNVTVIFKPDAKSSLMDSYFSKDKIWIEISKNVKPAIYEVLPTGLKQVPLPAIGTAGIAAGSPYHDDLFVTYSSFLTPSSLYFYQNGSLKKSKSLPAQFNTKGLVVEQLQATSKDGTAIPYFLIKRKTTVMNSKNPTLLYAYGGFQVSMTPQYSAVMGKTWLEQGGVYVLANIRGGGEFGPAWHQAALKENRQKAYDDFFSVAEDLIRRKITSPQKLAIRGGSNGGLLMGVSLTQRPDLFKAVICEVPLLDMMRYHLLLAGNSWVGEYGNPDIPAERSYIEKYSPYQNLKSGQNYPRVFFMTSTKDDRVHPGHARKMAALFDKMKIPFLYFENMEGGHGAAADLKQRAQYQALQTTFLMKELLD